MLSIRALRGSFGLSTGKELEPESSVRGFCGIAGGGGTTASWGAGGGGGGGGGYGIK